MAYRKLSKWERRLQKIRNWSYEFTDTKLALACLLFLVAVTFWFR